MYVLNQIYSGTSWRPRWDFDASTKTSGGRLLQACQEGVAWTGCGTGRRHGDCAAFQQSQVGHIVLFQMRGWHFFNRSVKVVPASTIRPFMMDDVPARDSELRRAYVEAEALK